MADQTLTSAELGDGSVCNRIDAKSGEEQAVADALRHSSIFVAQMRICRERRFPMAGVAHYVPGLLLAYAICALGILSPGPNVLTVMGTSMTEGRRLGRATAWAISSGSFLWALLTWAGLVAVIAAYASVLNAVKLYLLWLAFKAFRSAASANEPIAGTFAAARTKRAFFLRGLTIQMTNPKAAFSWISIMSLGL